MVWGVVAASTLAFALVAGSPVAIRSVTPRICVAPCTVRFSVKVTPAPQNAQLRVQLDGGMTYYSEIALSPNGPTLFPLTYKALPAGEYTILAELVQYDGRSWIAGRAIERVIIHTGW